MSDRENTQMREDATNMRIYLGGPINGGTDDEVNGWRDKFRSFAWAEDHIAFIDPMVRDYRGQEATAYREIVELDKADIESCDVCLFYAWQPSWGTAMEILHAWLAEKRIVVVIPAGIRVSPWVQYHADVIVPTLEDAAGEILGAVLARAKR